MCISDRPVVWEDCLGHDLWYPFSDWVDHEVLSHSYICPAMGKCKANKSETENDNSKCVAVIWN